MPHHYALGTPVEQLPPWLQAVAPHVSWRLLMPAVCEICGLRIEHGWQTTGHGYVYCRECIETLASAGEKHRII